MEAKKLNLAGPCFFCMAKTNGAWCEDCERDLAQEDPKCPVCARNSPASLKCGTCTTKQPNFTKTVALFKYQYPTNNLIKAFKYNNRPELANCFADRLTKKLLCEEGAMPKTLLPTPLHSKRQRHRGYNQSLELAHQLGKKLGIDVNSSLCRRIKNTAPQSKLPMKRRKENVKGAFQLIDHKMPGHIAIIDDVITTGATVDEIAGLLIKAGCQRVDVWSVART